MNEMQILEGEILIPSIERIRKFRLELEEHVVDASIFMSWVDKVMEHKVQELDIALPGKTLFRLPNRLFSYYSLMELKLSMDCELTVPDYVCLPRLKILHLSWLEFSDVRSTQKLFSSCPVLEELALGDCNWDRIGSILIYIPSLQTLSIDYVPMSDRYVPESRIMISAPNLLSFKCRSDAPVDLVLCNQSSLKDASIEVSLNPGCSLQQTLKLLLGVQGVKSLFLLSYTLETLLIEKDLHALLPSFVNLESLQVDCTRDKCIPRGLMKILRKTPKLQSLHMYAHSVSDDLTMELEDDGIPQCFKTSLKEFGFKTFSGDILEVRFLKYVLRNATLLENMLIKCLSKDLKEVIRSELELYRGAATEIKLVCDDV